MERRRLGFVLVLCLGARFSSAQSAPPSDQQALTIAAQSIAAMTGGSQVNDVSLSGTAVWTAGADQQTGNVTLLAKGFAESRMDLGLSGGQRSEIRNDAGGIWAGADGGYHDSALHNCWTDASWFFPALGSLASAATDSNVVLANLGVEGTQPSLQHLQAYTYNAALPDVQRLSTMDFYLNPLTLLPQIVTFNEHPDSDPTVNIGVEVMFSDYRYVNGTSIPFHIQRYVNNGLVLDIQLTSASINSGVSDNQFNVQ